MDMARKSWLLEVLVKVSVHFFITVSWGMIPITQPNACSWHMSLSNGLFAHFLPFYQCKYYIFLHCLSPMRKLFTATQVIAVPAESSRTSKTMKDLLEVGVDSQVLAFLKILHENYHKQPEIDQIMTFQFPALNCLCLLLQKHSDTLHVLGCVFMHLKLALATHVMSNRHHHHITLLMQAIIFNILRTRCKNSITLTPSIIW